MKIRENYYNYIGKAWLNIAKEIMSNGVEISRNDERYKELKGITFTVNCNFCEDEILNKYADSKMIKWMRNNFESIQTIKELRGANSYGERLYNYGGEKNQIEWIIKKINEKENVRSATITTFEPLTDTAYIPCISLFDFDVSGNNLDVYVYARALDFGAKAYANMVCIKEMLEKISKLTKYNVGNMHLICKSVHIYDYDYDKIFKIIKENISI